MTAKNEPQRLCVSCRQLKPKSELSRVVKFGDVISIDYSGKQSGRGAYVCKSEVCVQKAKKINAFAKSFKCFVDKTLYDNL